MSSTEPTIKIAVPLTNIHNLKDAKELTFHGEMDIYIIDTSGAVAVLVSRDDWSKVIIRREEV